MNLFFEKLTNYGQEKKRYLSDLFHQATYPQIALSMATGFGFGITLEAGLATIFGFATAGVLSLAAGGAVMVASLSLQKSFHQQDEISIQGAEHQVGSDSAPSIQIMSNDMHNGDIIHLTTEELDDVIHHRFASDMTVKASGFNHS
jgi:hypothetical protein